MSLALVAAIGPAQATPVDEDAKAVANAIDSFTNRLSSAADALGEYADLANNLPLTDLAPGDPDALDLSNLLKDKLGTLAGTYANMSELATAIEAKDDLAGSLKIQFGSGTLDPGQAAVSSTPTSITIPVHAERSVAQPLQFAFGSSVDMAGGSLGVDFELDTTLTFNVDSAAITSAATAPPTALSLVPPTIDLCANATGAVGVFTARFGFTDVKVSTDDPATPGTETAKLHACAKATFQDPDSIGGITLDEWTSHALTELATAAIVKGNPSGNDLDLKLYADASLVNGDAFTAATAADASITFTDADLSNGFNGDTDADDRPRPPGLAQRQRRRRGQRLRPVRRLARRCARLRQRPVAAARPVADGSRRRRQAAARLLRAAAERQRRLRHGAGRRDALPDGLHGQPHHGHPRVLPRAGAAAGRRRQRQLDDPRRRARHRRHERDERRDSRREPDRRRGLRDDRAGQLLGRRRLDLRRRGEDRDPASRQRPGALRTARRTQPVSTTGSATWATTPRRSR